MGNFDIKRTLLTLLVISGIWLVWLNFFAKKSPVQPQQQQTQTQTPTPTGTPAPTGTPTTAPTTAPAKPSSATATATAKKEPAEKVEIGTTRWKARFTTSGAALESFQLLDQQYRRVVDGHDVPVDLIPQQLGRATLETAFPDSSFAIDPDASWTVEKKAADEVVFAWQGEGVKITKRFHADPAPHTLSMTITVAATGDKPVVSHLMLTQFGWHDFGQKSGFGRPAPNIEVGACYINNKTQKKSFEQLKDKGPYDETGDVRWAGITDRYFLLAAAPAPDAKGGRNCHDEVVDVNAGTFRVSTRFPETKIDPGQSASVEMALFGGPKILKELDAVAIGGQDAKLGEAVDYGWWSPISRVMLAIMVGVHKVIPSWGLAIIALTLLVKLLTYPLTQKSMRSGKEMAKLKPKIEQLQKRYKDDKQRLNMEMMNLYKTHGVNPLGGCLPMLIQLPIWWALYATLGNAVELYRSRFLWMHDLTQPDPFYITPIAMGAFMFLQQRITPMPTDSQQQKTMMYMMPVLFTFMSLWFPAGLTVYILTNTLLTMLQQWFINRKDPLKKKVLKPARAS